jgi:type I restriction enzyme S subunit
MQTEAFHEHSIKQSKGSVNPYINFTDLEWWEFGLPPIEEQRKIVQICTAVNTYNHELQVAIIKALQVEVAWLKSIIERYENLGYTKISLGKVLEKSPESGVSAPPQATDTGHWVLALNALTEMGYLPGQLKPVEPTEIMLSALLYRGDLLISRSNTLERVGFVGIYNGENEGFVSFPDTMMRLRCRSDIVLPEYLELYFQSAIARNQITSIAAGTSASMKKINKTNLQNLSIIILPLDEQRQVIINRKQIASGRLAIIKRLRQSKSQYFRLLNHVIFAN